MEIIKIENLKKAYQIGDVEVNALRKVDLVIRKGEFVSVMGSSGSGKSTLMNLLGCLDKPTSGTYLLDGEQIDKLKKSQLSDIRNQKIGFVFQGFNLLARTSALENVELPLLYRRGGRIKNPEIKAKEALDRVGLADRLWHEPSQLSGGQQQRVALARALVNEPAIILADEPTGNLDSGTSIEMMKILQNLNDQGITILLVTHEGDIAFYSKRIVTLKDGMKIGDEPVSSVRSAYEDLKALEAQPLGMNKTGQYQQE
ncbi:MAG: ABC transporter ATP-binding protein [Acidobacteriota bacterium]